MAVTVLLNNASQNGPGNALDVRGADKASFLVGGDFDATVKFEASLDGTEWFSYYGKAGAAKVLTNGVSHPCFVVFDAEGVAYIRPVIANYRSGAVTVKGYVETASGKVMIWDGTNVAAVTATGQLKVTTA